MRKINFLGVCLCALFASGVTAMAQEEGGGEGGMIGHHPAVSRAKPQRRKDAKE